MNKIKSISLQEHKRTTVGLCYDLQSKLNEVIEEVNKIKDNPVPSLDKFDEEWKHLMETKYKDTGVSWFTYKQFIQSKLQNGVETDNEQPKQVEYTGV